MPPGVARPGTPWPPWHALARPGTPWHALARLGTPWHILARPGTPDANDAVPQVVVAAAPENVAALAGTCFVDLARVGTPWRAFAARPGPSWPPWLALSRQTALVTLVALGSPVCDNRCDSNCDRNCDRICDSICDRICDSTVGSDPLTIVSTSLQSLVDLCARMRTGTL